MLKIDGVVIPTPSAINISIMDLSNAERNAAGYMVIDRIATKRKIDMTWKYLSREDLALLFARLSPVFFQAEYIDPQEGMKSGLFYAGDRKAGALDYKNGIIRYKDVSVNIIER